jgi:hypothetical protein
MKRQIGLSQMPGSNSKRVKLSETISMRKGNAPLAIGLKSFKSLQKMLQNVIVDERLIGFLNHYQL